MSALSGLSGDSEPDRGGDAAHLALRQLAEGEQRPPERVLVERVEDVGLVLLGVRGRQQPVPPLEAVDARVVPGREQVAAHRHGPLEERREFHVLVAGEARVRRAPIGVGLHERPEDVALELALHVEDVVRDADALRGGTRVRDVLDAAAGPL